MPRIVRIAADPIEGNSTLAVSTIDNVTNTATTAEVKTFRRRLFTHGPNTSRSLHNNSRNTVADGNSTPARVCTPSVSNPSGLPGISTIVAATNNRPANTA